MAKQNKPIFAHNNKYEKNIFKRFGAWFGGLKAWKKVLIIVLIVVIIAAAVVAGYVYSRLNKITKPKESNIKKTELSCVDVDGYTNILMLGVDSRDMNDVAGSNTDAIMIISINQETKDVNLISVYRDTYLKIGDTSSYNKVNSAFAAGSNAEPDKDKKIDSGAKMTIQTLNQAMDLNITNYVLVNFKSVSDLVNAVDGITVNVKEEEIQQLNKYTRQTANNIGQKKYKTVTKAGKQKLEGVQAVAYGRIRKGVGDDFKRTSRMRVVLSKVFDKLKKCSLGELDDVLDLMLPECQTNLSNNDIIGLAARAASYNIKGSTGWPYQVTTGYVGEAACVFPGNLAENTKKLHEEMFGQKNYEVSETVQSIANTILGFGLSQTPTSQGNNGATNGGTSTYNNNYNAQNNAIQTQPVTPSTQNNSSGNSNNTSGNTNGGSTSGGTTGGSTGGGSTSGGTSGGTTGGSTSGGSTSGGTTGGSTSGGSTSGGTTGGSSGSSSGSTTTPETTP